MTLEALRALAEPAEDGFHRFPAPYKLMAIALEEGDFLYAYVRATRPRNILELGTGLGVSTRFLAQALVDNDDGGWLVTVEPDPEVFAAVHPILGQDIEVAGRPLPVQLFREVGHVPFPDLVYIDSGYKTRPDDLKTWLTNGYPGVVIVHDAERDYPEFQLGQGVTVPTVNGMWIGRAK